MQGYTTYQFFILQKNFHVFGSIVICIANIPYVVSVMIILLNIKRLLVIAGLTRNPPLIIKGLRVKPAMTSSVFRFLRQPQCFIVYN